MYATTDWGGCPPPTPLAAPRARRRARSQPTAVVALASFAAVLVLAAHLSSGWPRLVMAVVACSWAAAALARSALPD